MIVDFWKLTVNHFLRLKFPQSTEEFSCNHNTSLEGLATSLSGETQNHTNYLGSFVNCLNFILLFVCMVSL